MQRDILENSNCHITSSAFENHPYYLTSIITSVYPKAVADNLSEQKLDVSAKL